MTVETKELERLIGIVERLRAKDGCPWDRVQTHATLKVPCIEEAAEVICGINILAETGDPENLKEELGDLLFQVVFHASLAQEEARIDLAENQKRLVRIEEDLTKARTKFNRFLKELGLEEI